MATWAFLLGISPSYTSFSQLAARPPSSFPFTSAFHVLVQSQRRFAPSLTATVCECHERPQASLPRHHVWDGRRPIPILALSRARLVPHTQPIYCMHFGIRITPWANQSTTSRASRAKPNLSESPREGMRWTNTLRNREYAYPFRGSSTYDRALATTESEETRNKRLWTDLLGGLQLMCRWKDRIRQGRQKHEFVRRGSGTTGELECGVGERLGECSRRISCSIRTAVLLCPPR